MNYLKKYIPILLYLTAITPTIVLSNFLFPYISTRTIFFRLLIEAGCLALLWIFVKHKIKLSEQPNYFFWVFSFFAITNIISSFFSFSFLVAWFSDFERMWGVFTLLHLFLFYILLRSFLGGKEWKLFLNILVAVSLIVACYGLFQYYPELGVKVFQSGRGRIISTLGNSAYVAIYLLFNIFFALFLLSKSNRHWWKFYYAAVVLIDFWAFTLAGIRGTMIGLIAGLGVSALLYIFLGKNRKYKAGVGASLIIMVSIVLFAFLFPTNYFIKNNPLLSRFASISLSDGTAETRLIGWRAAWKGFLEHPIFGVGMDNYNTVFNKYFDANYYLIAPTEPYFDRSHNAWLDALVMSGAAGFILFLCFPVGIFYYLVKGYRRGIIELSEFLIFAAMSIAYFTHLIFVFDDLNSYLYFVVMIAFIEYRHRKEPLLNIGEEDKKPGAAKWLAAVAAGIIIFLAAYNLNFKVMLAGHQTVWAMQDTSDITKAVPAFEQALDYNLIPSRNVLMSYLMYLSNTAGNLQPILSDPQKKQVLEEGVKRALLELDKEIKKDPVNALVYNRQAVVDNIAYLVFNDPQYISAAIEANQKAISLSKEHLQYYYALADTYIISGQPQLAVDAVNQSLAINGKYNVGYYALARAYVVANELDKSLASIRQAMQLGYSPDDNSLFRILSQKYEEQKNYSSAIDALELYADYNNKDVNILARLARLYLVSGKNSEAIAAAEKIKAIDAKYAPESDYLIEQIKAGRSAEVLKELSQ